MEEGHRIVWDPNPGGQIRFLTCPFWEALGEGNRGGGKTETLLVDFAQHVGMGFGSYWRGVLFRREYKHLDDVIVKSKRLFRQAFPGARWLSSKSDYKWVWPDGEELLFRHFKRVDDYWDYHGHEYPWIGWEELTNWPTDDCYEAMKACSRSSLKGMPRKYRSTTNPFGSGHGWVKERFIDIGPAETVVTDEDGLERCRVHIDLHENKHLLEGTPEYEARLNAIKNPELRKAWRDGDWDINVGGFLQGVWDRSKHVVPAFEPPVDWPRWRAMDWGFAKPYSVGWYTVDPDGVIYRYRESYGYGGKADVGTRESATIVAGKIKDLEKAERKLGIEFRRNPADSQLWHDQGVEVTPGELFSKSGVRWVPAKKGPGSRRAGAQVVIDLLTRGLFKVTDNCTHWLRTVPGLMPDESDWEVPDTEQEDHCWDETVYSLVSRHKPRKERDQDEGPKPYTFDWLVQPTKPKKSIYRL